MKFTVRMSSEDVRSMTLEEITALNESLQQKGDSLLQKIRRSNGDTEYVTKDVLKELNAGRKRRAQLAKLSEGDSRPARKRGLLGFFSK